LGAGGAVLLQELKEKKRKKEKGKGGGKKLSVTRSPRHG
jgi:hypothetical protein